MRTYTQLTLSNTHATLKQRRRSDKPDDKRRCPKDRAVKGSHLGTSDEWHQAVIEFMEEQDYYRACYKQRKYIKNKIIYQLVVKEARE